MHMLQSLPKYSSVKEQKSNKFCTDNSKTKCRFLHISVLIKFFMEVCVFVSAFTKGSIAEISTDARLLLAGDVNPELGAESCSGTALRFLLRNL